MPKPITEDSQILYLKTAAPNSHPTTLPAIETRTRTITKKIKDPLQEMCRWKDREAKKSEPGIRNLFQKSHPVRLYIPPDP
jgi:hypothetical protein